PELKQTDSQKIDEILRQLRDVKTTSDNVRAELDNLETREKLRNQKLAQEIGERIERGRDSLGSLKGRIKRLQTDLAALRAQPSTSNRTANYPAPGNGAAPPPPGSTTIRLRNTFPEEVSVVVNGVSHRLMPGQTQDLFGQPGPFTYEIIGIQ